jgi:hypothetical protein
MERQHVFAQVALDRFEAAAGGGEIGVDEPARSKGAVEHGVAADDVASQSFDSGIVIHRCSPVGAARGGRR